MAVSLALLLGACTSPYPSYFERGVRVAGQTVEVDTSQALVLPEPGAAPRVLSVLQTAYSNAIMQEIILETNSSARGQNAFHVTFFGPVERVRAGSYSRSDDFLNEEALEEEMEKQLPGVTMHTSNYFVQNRYGPFNYAMGRGGAGEICMYAWQRIQSRVPVYRLVRDSGVLSVRLRLCQKGASEQDLLRVMYRYSINGYFLPRGWQPYGRPMGEPEGLGRIGGPLAYPTGVQGNGTVLDGWMGPEPAAAPAPRATARRYGSRVEQPEPVEQPSAYDPVTDGYTPAAGYPVVPPPDTSGAAATPAAPRPVSSGTTGAARSATTGASSGYAPAPMPSAAGGAAGTTGTAVRVVPGTATYPATTTGQ
ncbi:cellulose biosynthesis protein BcsN [Ancylobacter sp. Lp-2]|uniref:cellulose biosynthesis protein BcsN n=1 Tax=Ancylobacter sp. Lp-2 TaxID=2881339 RepID=UPI001E62ACAC|nr:cellulose biosynthesis protein BcsN [Ancylobacter sp. Lp-2]MCB4771914.1 cellulose biosynthesis protein BcsN [Ancylobacter sp. Lp-2]